MKKTALLLSAFAVACTSLAAEYYVDASRPDDTGDGTTWPTAKKTIQAAVDLTPSGGTVWVTNGTYLLSSEISVTNAITLQSVNGPDVTIIDGGGSTRCFKLSGECLLRGLTITRGVAWEQNGGGVLCENLIQVVSNCVFLGNSTPTLFNLPGAGGGMFRGIALDCVFNSNGAHCGGGMAQGIAQNCIFLNNYGIGDSQWGNSYGAGKSGGEARNCLFVDNGDCFSGAGMSDGTAVNCTFFRNNAQFEGGAFARGTIINSLFTDNISGFGYTEIADSEVFYSCSTQLTHGVNGNITNAPLFVDAESGDFRLMANSPGINWGDNSVVSNATDLDGNVRIVEGVVDMGAYEYQGTVGLADSDDDGLDDDWEREHGGNQSPDAICSNGVNTIRQAYVAGLDPKDPASRFLASAHRSPIAGNILQWQGAAGRVYSVYYSTNLLDGFLPLQTDIPWTTGCFTDAVHHAKGQIYYKVDVQLEEASGGNPFDPPPGGGGDDGDVSATGI